MSRIAVIVHTRAKGVALFYVALLYREIKQITCRKPVNKPGDYLFYEFPFVQDRLANEAAEVITLRSVLHVHLFGIAVYHDNETVRALISDERQRRVFRQRFGRRAKVSVRQVRRIEHDMGRKRLDFSGARIEVANVAGEHVGNSGATWGDVFSRTKSFLDLGVDLRHWFALHEQFADPQNLRQNCRRSFRVETNGLLIQGMITIDDAGEAVCACAHFDKAISLEHVHTRVVAQMLGSSTERQCDFLLSWKQLRH